MANHIIKIFKFQINMIKLTIHEHEVSTFYYWILEQNTARLCSHYCTRILPIILAQEEVFLLVALKNGKEIKEKNETYSFLWKTQMQKNQPDIHFGTMFSVCVCSSTFPSLKNHTPSMNTSLRTDTTSTVICQNANQNIILGNVRPNRDLSLVNILKMHLYFLPFFM